MCFSGSNSPAHAHIDPPTLVSTMQDNNQLIWYVKDFQELTFNESIVWVFKCMNLEVTDFYTEINPV